MAFIVSFWNSVSPSLEAGDPSPLEVDLPFGVSASSTASTSLTLPPSLLSLPQELWLHVLASLSISDLSHIAQTCKDFNDVCSHNVLWKPLTLDRFPELSKLEQVDLSEALLNSEGSWRTLSERLSAFGWTARRTRVLRHSVRAQIERALAIATLGVPWYAVLSALHAWSWPHAVFTGALSVTALTHAFFATLHKDASAPLSVRTTSTRYALDVARPPPHTRERSARIVRATRVLWTIELFLYAAGTLLAFPWWLWHARLSERRLLAAMLAPASLVSFLRLRRVRPFHVLLLTAPIFAVTKTNLFD